MSLVQDIDYFYEYRFPDRKNKSLLWFDFWIPKYNLIIEFQGEQHYKPVELFGGKEGFEYRKKLDKIKVEYCLKTNKKLLTISYLDFRKIKNILLENIKL